jgi:hypothetical protein
MRCTRDEERKIPDRATRHPAITFAAAAALGFGALVVSPGQFIKSGVPIPLAFT